jgi:cell division protein ZapB
MKNDDPDPNHAAGLADDFAAGSETAATNLLILTRRLDQLLAGCERLAQDNQVLREQHDALQAERDTLHDKYEHARARIEAMIVRLKGLEQNS